VFSTTILWAVYHRMKNSSNEVGLHWKLVERMPRRWCTEADSFRYKYQQLKPLV